MPTITVGTWCPASMLQCCMLIVASLCSLFLPFGALQRDPASRPSSRGSSTASLRADSERETKRPLRTPYELPIRDTEGGARGAGFLSDESLSSRINRHRSSDPVVKSPVKSLPTPPDAMPSAEFSARDVGEESDSSRSGAGAEGVNEQLARGAGGFQVQFVRNLMDDALEDFREEMRRDMLNLHMEVIKQSQVIQVRTFPVGLLNVPINCCRNGRVSKSPKISDSDLFSLSPMDSDWNQKSFA